jgi:hypothetical protein
MERMMLSPDTAVPLRLIIPLMAQPDGMRIFPSRNITCRLPVFPVK